MIFDVRTAYILTGLLYLLLPAAGWLALRPLLGRSGALWFGGTLLVGVASLLMTLRGMAPDWLTAHLPNCLQFGAMQIMAVAVRLDLGLPVAWQRRAAALLLFVAIQAPLEVGQPPRLFVVNSIHCSQMLLLAALLLRLYRKEQLRMIRWVALAYALVAGALTLRMLVVAAGWSPANPLHTTMARLIPSPQGGLMADPLHTPRMAYDLILVAVALMLSAIAGSLGYAGIYLDRAARAQTQREVERARALEARRLTAQIAHLERQRSVGEMARSLAHEISQPLTAILSNAQLAQRVLQGPAPAPGQLSPMLEKVVRNTRRASEIVDRIRGRIRPSEPIDQEVDLADLCREVAELAQDEARGAGVRLLLAPAPPGCIAFADRVLLSQILINLLRNAIEATQDAPAREVHMSVRKLPSQVEVEVRDSGPGLSSEALALAGTPFFTTKAQGMGLGLSISRSIAQQYGGQLRLQNAQDGAGAVATLDLPRNRNDA